MDRYAVMGNPIAHSLSPRIHRLFAEQTAQSLTYEAIAVQPGGFETAVREFQSAGGKGLNITLPFKHEACELADERTPRAARAGAVNTLVLGADARSSGDNTDGVGLLRDLADNHRVTIAGRTLLILGAGGAVRGVLEPLLSAGPSRLVIANRTAARAGTLAREFAHLGPIEGRGLDALTGEQFDVVINATAAGVTGELPALPDDILRGGGCCYDLFYAREPTAFVRWGRAHGAGQSLDGLGMLVEQAAESFRLWRGVRPSTHNIVTALRT